MLGIMPPAAVRLRLAELLKERKMTQAEFSLRTGLSKNAISKLTGQPRQIRLDTIEAICNALGVTPGELFERQMEN